IAANGGVVQTSSTCETRPGNEDQVEGPVADHLVGDRDVATSGVVGLRDLHGASLEHRKALSKRAAPGLTEARGDSHGKGKTGLGATRGQHDPPRPAEVAISANARKRLESS